MARRAKFAWRERVPFWALLAFLALVMLTGGAARSDVQSLIFLRPASIIFCGLALWSLRWEDVKAHAFLFWMALGLLVLVGLHLVPLPPYLWGAMPGRALLVEIDKAAEMGAVWRPLAIVPAAAWNALFALFAPLAVLLLGVQLDREQRFDLLPFVIGMGLVSGFLGLLQAIGDPTGPLYLYNVTNNGASVGLFSNRNHQAVFLALQFPLLAVYASAGIRTEEQLRFRSGVALAAGAILVPLLLVTGSRTGLIAGILSLAASYLLYHRPNIGQPKKRKGKGGLNWRWPIVGFVVLCLGAVTFLMSRAEALQRLTSADQAEDFRFKALGPVLDMAWKYFPFGSGAGSFAEAFQIDEPLELLKPTYFNHAHNDWVEVYLTFGAPGVVLLILAVLAWAKIAFHCLKRSPDRSRDLSFRHLGVIVVALFALGSASDYPLRVPSLMCVFVIASLWISGTAAKNAGGQSDTPLARAQEG